MRPDRLKESCSKAEASAAGTDGWAPADFKALLGVAMDWMAKLLNQTEAKGQWPKGQSSKGQ